MLPPKIEESVEEFHGPYGPYQVSELVLQRIWMQRAFDQSRLRDQWGRTVEILETGKWNRLEGPDFLGARLRIDGEEVHGDVEIHFCQTDWRAHGHHQDPAYRKVVLHVLYHEVGESSTDARTDADVVLPYVSLLPLLWYSLEEYAGDDSLVASTQVDLRPEIERLLQLDLKGRRLRLRSFAKKRWNLKVHFAQKRIERLGWSGACHQSALEVMGFARNRVPMLMIAERVGLRDFENANRSVNELYSLGEDRWRLAGCRPSNYPKTRIQQYLDLCRNVQQWPDQVSAFLEGMARTCSRISTEEWGSKEVRKKLGISPLRKELLATVLGGAISKQKGDTLVCDALLPLCWAHSSVGGFELWFHWNAGNAPADCQAALKTLQVVEARRIPFSNGWVQGVLGARNEERGSGFEPPVQLQADA